MKLCGVIQSCELTEPVYDAERILNLEATLTEILNAREERMREQNEMISLYGKPLVSFTMNIAGPVKNSLLIQKAFEEGLLLLRLFWHFRSLREGWKPREALPGGAESQPIHPL